MRELNKKVWPFKLTIHGQDKVDKAIVWCNETIPGRHRWYWIGNQFYFRTKADAVLFSLACA